MDHYTSSNTDDFTVTQIAKANHELRDWLDIAAVQHGRPLTDDEQAELVAYHRHKVTE